MCMTKLTTSFDPAIAYGGGRAEGLLDIARVCSGMFMAP